MLVGKNYVWLCSLWPEKRGPEKTSSFDRRNGFLPGETAKSFTVEGVGSSPYDELLALRLVSHSDEVGVCGGLTVVRIKKNMDSEPESVDGNVQYDEACRIFFERVEGGKAEGGMARREVYSGYLPS